MAMLVWNANETRYGYVHTYLGSTVDLTLSGVTSPTAEPPTPGTFVGVLIGLMIPETGSLND